MANIKFDGVEYDIESLAQETRSEFEMLVASEQKMRELQKELAIVQTARNAYARALKDRLGNEKPSVTPAPSDSLSVDV